MCMFAQYISHYACYYNHPSQSDQLHFSLAIKNAELAGRSHAVNLIYKNRAARCTAE